MPWLLDRLFAHGDQTAPRFAFQGTVNWMRAVAIHVPATRFTHNALRHKYEFVQRKAVNIEMDTLALECLAMSVHNAAAARSIATVGPNKYNLCRVGIVSWYYTVYYAAKAMIAAASGSDPQTHAKAARVFHADIIQRELAVYPFDLYVEGISPTRVGERISALRGANQFDLNTRPTTDEQAHGALCSYLKGTCEYRQWEIEQTVRESREFRDLGVDNFRTRAARDLRDTALNRESVNFLVQAFRYRGKANYRDAIYLSYGDDNSATLATFVNDLGSVATSFSFMASHYVARRVEATAWTAFAIDMHEHGRFDAPYDFREI
jgi:hypothetical protein